MASDNLRRISEAEERAAAIEREADEASASLLASSERTAREKVQQLDQKIEDEIRQILRAADEDRVKLEEDAVRFARKQDLEMRAEVAPRVPVAIAAVRDILIGRV